MGWAGGRPLPAPTATCASGEGGLQHKLVYARLDPRFEQREAGAFYRTGATLEAGCAQAVIDALMHLGQSKQTGRHPWSPNRESRG